MPRQAFWLGTSMNGIGSMLIITNWHEAIGASCLIVFTIAATLLLLRYWEVEDAPKRSAMQTGFLNNFAILGGLLLLLQRFIGS